MRKLVYVAILTVVVAAAGAFWWSTGGPGAGPAVSDDTAEDGEACTSCTARHQRLTKSKDETGAE